MDASKIIEARVIAHLAANLTGCTVAAEVPEDYTDALIVVSRVGEQVDNHLRRTRLAVQCYGATMLDAAARCEDAVGALMTLPANDAGVTALRVETTYNWTDETTKRYRYQAVVHVSYYEEED